MTFNTGPGMGWGPNMMGGYGQAGFPGGYGSWGGPYAPWAYGTWGGTYPGGFYPPTPMAGYGPTPMPGYAPPMSGYIPTDDQITEMILENIDADPSVPYNLDIDLDVSGGVASLTGTVPNKMIKHALGDDAWLTPGVIDVNNNLQISGRRARREEERTGSEQPRQVTRGRTGQR